jgi:hypothetical protein
MSQGSRQERLNKTSFKLPQKFILKNHDQIIFSSFTNQFIFRTKASGQKSRVISASKKKQKL